MANALTPETYQQAIEAADLIRTLLPLGPHLTKPHRIILKIDDAAALADVVTHCITKHSRKGTGRKPMKEPTPAALAMRKSRAKKNL